MSKIYLRAGHGGRFSGARGNGLVEKDLALELTLELFKELSNYEVDLKLARDKDVTMGVSESVAEANIWGADLYYSRHHNAFSSSSPRGFDTHIHPQAFAKTKEIQRAIHPIIAAVWVQAGSRDRGFRTNNFYELRETDMSAIIIENGFLTNPEDAALLKNKAFKQRLVQAETEALVDYFNLKRIPQEAKGTLKRVFVNGEQVGAYRTNKYLTKFIASLIESNQYDIEIKEIK